MDSKLQLLQDAQGRYSEIINIMSNEYTPSSTHDAFIGIDTDNYQNVIEAIQTYKDEIKKTIDGFDATISFKEALKGETSIAVDNFVAAVKELMMGYVDYLNRLKVEMVEHVKSYKTNEGFLAEAVTGSANSIREQASTIVVD